MRGLDGAADTPVSAGDVLVVAIFQAIYSRYSPLAVVITKVEPGTAAITRIMPKPISAIINVNPIDTPNMCGIVRRNPKLMPDVISIRLFGPGVIEDTRAKAANAANNSVVIMIWPR